jgi:thioredoxin reductase (NADPH)
VALSDKLDMELRDRQASETFAPCVEVCLADGTPTGLAFHGVPGGHEFTSFVLGLYNAAGPGQALDEATRKQIADLKDKVDIKLLVTLSCTMCPDLVVAAQRIAAENPNVTAHVYDIRHFENLKTRYNVMSVPCMIVNDDMVFFGKKNVSQILSLLNG